MKLIITNDDQTRKLRVTVREKLGDEMILAKSQAPYDVEPKHSTEVYIHSTRDVLLTEV